MRVLFASSYPHLPDIVGGLQTTTDDLCLALQDAGIEVAVLCGQSEHAHDLRGSSTVRRDNSLGYPVIRAADPLSALATVAASWDPSVIVVQSGTTLLPLAVASLETGYPTAVYLHNVELHQLGGHLVPDPDILYLANSAFTARRFRALAGIDCVVVPPLVIAERYLTAQRGEHVLYVNPAPIKGVEIVLGVAALCPDIPFLIAESWGLHGEWLKYCRDRAETLGNITWQSPTRDMQSVFGRCRTLLMPSIWEESFGRTVVEAQINGIPVVASNRGALPETVGEGGILIDPHAPLEEWKAALGVAYHSSPDYDALSEAARRHAFSTAATAPLVANLMTALATHANRNAHA